MKVQLSSVVLLAFVFQLLSSLATAQENPHHPLIPAYEKFIDVDSIPDSERGSLLINELNCAACHNAQATNWAVSPKQAPILSKIGNRARPEYFEKFLLAPHQTKPGTTMPDVLASKSSTEKKQIAESLAHFLASTGTTTETPPFPGPVANGERLFHSIGCVACHDPQKDLDNPLETSVPLGKLESKYTIPGLASFLQDPLKFRPSGRMPHLSLSGKEAQEIASYLLKDIKVKSNINVAVYHGSWDQLPDFDKLKPVSTGSVPTISAKHAGRGDNFGLVFIGYWTVTNAGKYDFSLSSDDGSRLIINGKRVIDNDGIHGVQTRSGSLELKPGVHSVRIEFFEKAGGEEVKCEVRGPGLGKQPIGGVLKASKEPPMDKDRFVLDTEKAKRGAEYFQSVGCANCHEMKTGNQQLASNYSTKNLLVDLKEGGCIDGTGDVPQFGLTKQQKVAIQAALGVKQSKPDAKTRIHQTLTTLNCYACHERNFVGGVVDRKGESDEIYGREKWFTSNQPEMGDEGRLPPLLSGVGSKLNPKWLAEVIDNGAKERPYMSTRMPKFGKPNYGSLVDDLMQADKLEKVVRVRFDISPRKVKAIGKSFAGTSEKENGLSCVKCHTFGKYKATGIQAISLTSMSKRLNQDWFQLYMMKPSRYRPGTRMPESWPGGQSFFPEILDGDANKQIAAIWEYLSDGEKAAKPKGLVQAKLQLVATDSPRIYRNFIQGAGPRAIGVGYPEEINLAFDANNNRLAMLWTGAFIDASKHWTGRGQGFQPPLGDNVLNLPEGVAFANPSVAEKAWPKQSAKELGLRFKGYRFDRDRQPSFQYQQGDLEISDFPVPSVSDEDITLKRTFQLKSAKTKSVWYRAAVGSKITKNKDGTYSIGQDYQTRISTDNEILIRDSGGNQELIIKLKLENGSTEFTQEYIW